MKKIIERIQIIILVSLQEILDKIYQILAHPPTCQSSIVSVTAGRIVVPIGSSRLLNDRINQHGCFGVDL